MNGTKVRLVQKKKKFGKKFVFKLNQKEKTNEIYFCVKLAADRNLSIVPLLQGLPKLMMNIPTENDS